MEDYCDKNYNLYKKKRLRKGLFQLVLVVGFICLILVVNVQENTSSKKLHEEEEEDVKVYGQRPSGVIHRKMELINIVSKRKVPKGPDPIHNRRAGNSHQPPGRA